MNYAHQHRLLSFALRGLGVYADEGHGHEPMVTYIFRHWHGHQNARKGWSLLDDAQLRRVIGNVWRRRDYTREWRRLLQAVLYEAALRGMLPRTADEFRVAWDRCASQGLIQPGDEDRLSLIEAWEIVWGVT